MASDRDGGDEPGAGTGGGLDGVASPARFDAAASLRRLGHGIVGHDVADEVLERIRASVERALAEVEASPPRTRPVGTMKRQRFDHVPADGDVLDHFPDCIVSGLANPLGIAIRAHREGDDAVARVTLDSAFEGAPGRAHGGVVAAIFDDTFGFVLDILNLPAYTGRLSVSYRAPTPMHEEIEFRARLRERDGRKLFFEGEASVAGERIADAEGLFIVIPSGYEGTAAGAG